MVEIESHDPTWRQVNIGRFRLSVSSAPEASRNELWRARLGRSTLSGWARLAAACAIAGRRAEAVAVLAKAGREAAGEFIDDLFLLALIEQQIGRPAEARRWLERGLARYDKNTADMDLKHLAADACTVALDQEPMDVAFLSRVWTTVSAAEALTSVTTGNDPLAVALRHGRTLFDEGKTERAVGSLEALLLSVNQDFRPTSTRSALAFELAGVAPLGKRRPTASHRCRRWRPIREGATAKSRRSRTGSAPP